MATSVVSPLDSRSRDWPDSRMSPGNQTTIPFNLMARSPPINDDYRSNFANTTRLPSISNFLSGVAPRTDLDLAPLGSAPNRVELRTPSTTSLSTSHSLVHHANQPNVYNHSSQNGLHHGEHVAQHQANHPPPGQPVYWSHPNPHPMDRNRNFPAHHPQTSPINTTHAKRHIAEQEIPGKGICYIYEDGSICQKVANGDGVNPNWGTTKAGKPRKRLGQACNTCREKKIKCDPSVPKCAQCQKFGRECKFESLTRTTQKQSSALASTANTPSAEHPAETSSPRRGSTASTDIVQDQISLKQAHRSSLPVESLLSPTSVDDGGIQRESPENLPPAKRTRLLSSPKLENNETRSEQFEHGPLLASQTRPPIPSRFTPATDPYEVDPDLTVYYVGKYFIQSESFSDCPIPQKPFMHWLKTCSSKSPSDIMLIYAMMAFGATFARRVGLEGHPDMLTTIVHEALINTGDIFNLQLLHTRLILSVLAFAQGQYNRAFEYSGTAMRIAINLGYNMEDSVTKITTDAELAFGLDKNTLIECRRRTFWSSYIKECFNGCCSSSVPAVYRTEIHLRLLPFDPQHPETDSGPVTPLHFRAATCDRSESSDIGKTGLLGHRVEIATIFNQVLCQISRPMQGPSAQYHNSMKEFNEEITARLSVWDKSLSDYVQRGRDSKDKSEPVSGLHIVYHYIAMILNRHVRHHELDSQSIVTHVKAAYHHARRTLELVQRLSNVQKKDVAMFRLAASNPFCGFVVTAALDTITAAGTLREVMDGYGEIMSLISGGLEAVERLVDYWHSAKQQRDLIETRLRYLLTSAQKASSHQGAFYFSEPMQSLFGPEQDIIYGISRKKYLQALGYWDNGSLNEGEFQRLG